MYIQPSACPSVGRWPGGFSHLKPHWGGDGPKRYRSGLLREGTYMPGTDKPLIDELDGIIALHKLRIQQQRFHASELSADPTQQKLAQAQLAAMKAGLAKLQEFRRRFA